MSVHPAQVAEIARRFPVITSPAGGHGEMANDSMCLRVRPFFRLDQRISDAICDVTKLRGTVEPSGSLAACPTTARSLKTHVATNSEATQGISCSSAICENDLLGLIYQEFHHPLIRLRRSRKRLLVLLAKAAAFFSVSAQTFRYHHLRRAPLMQARPTSRLAEAMRKTMGRR
jgi:hypothetical protein